VGNGVERYGVTECCSFNWVVRCDDDDDDTHTQETHLPYTGRIALHVSTSVQNLHQEENPNEKSPRKTACTFQHVYVRADSSTDM
jgi:hypothetical protein